jgi:hypothetical protein
MKATEIKIKNWYTKKELAQLTKKSEKTIDRRKKELLEINPDLDWFRDNNKPHKFSYKMIEEFMSPEIFQLIKENRQFKNTIDCLSTPGTLEHHLSLMDWDYFVTISWEDLYNKERCRTEMDSLYRDFDNYGFGAKNRMFYTTEPFTNRRGCHNHFALKLEGSNNIQIKEFIEKNAPKGIVDVKPWDNYKAGIFYITKDGTEGVDWDILGNNLKEDGVISKFFRKVS